MLEVADVVQIGARNMQNYPLLAEIGRSGRPALLKRGLSATLDELLMAAEYILKEGNPNVMLCERGIRTFETAYRFTLDLMAVPVLKELTHLPVIVDPSHAAGRRDLVAPLSLAAAAVGADGIIVEVHPNPDEAICDGPQALARTTSRSTRGPSSAPPRWRARRSAPSDGPQPARQDHLRVAVLGVGLIGGSIGLAARERARREVCGFDPDGRVRARALELGAIDTQADGLAAPSPDAEVVFVAAPVGALAETVRRALAAAGPDCVVSDVGSTKRVARRRGRRRALHRRAPARGRRDRRRRARARGPVRRRHVVPDARRRAAPRASSTSACTGCSRASARARRRSTPTPTTA